MTETSAMVALVSGGSRGIGRAVVVALARTGYDVSFCYRNDQSSADKVVAEVTALGRRCRANKVDVTDYIAVRAWISATESDLGPIDVAVTSAGITRDSPLALMHDDDWHSVIDTNLGGVYAVCRVVVFEMMKRRSGAIVNISSVAGVYGNASQTNYAAAKAGIIAFSRSLAKESGRFGVRVNTVSPGLIETDMTAAVDPGVIKDILPRIALRRKGLPEEVAESVLFLVSPQASYLTGSVLSVDGGISL